MKIQNLNLKKQLKTLTREELITKLKLLDANIRATQSKQQQATVTITMLKGQIQMKQGSKSRVISDSVDLHSVIITNKEKKK